jgi:dextranase
VTGPRPGVAGRITIRSLVPVRPFFPPGEEAKVELEVAAESDAVVRTRLELIDLDRVVGVARRSLRLRAGVSRRRLAIVMPAVPRRGYALRLTLEAAGAPAVRATCVLEALAGWWESPRHAVLTEMRTPSQVAAAVRGFAPWHVNVVQFYDWMYRHYRYAPPRDQPFRDALGRRVSPAAVRAGVRECRRSGIAALAYGSVYGAEREYIDSHESERVFDAAGKPLSLGETFYLTDLRPGHPWRRRLLHEYDRACLDFGFDGIHMDTYGEPHEGLTADGTPFRFEDLYPGLIDEAAARLAGIGGRKVLFNCVGGYPLDAVAQSGAAAIYLELWAPAARYQDVVSWIDRARRVGGGRAVVIAAYISALREAWSLPESLDGAREAVVLFSSVIVAAGAYHQILADRDRGLVEGYYPAALALGGRATRELQAAWRFGARYLHYLSDPDLASASAQGIELRDGQGRVLPVSEIPEAGHVWLRVSATRTGARTISLIDLREQHDDRWDAVRQAPGTAAGWSLRLPNSRAPLVAMSPWTVDGEPARLRADPAAEARPTWRLPRFRRWLLVVESTD